MGNQCCNNRTVLVPNNGFELSSPRVDNPITAPSITPTTITTMVLLRHANINGSQNSDLDIIISSQDEQEDLHEDIQRHLPKLEEIVIKRFKKHKVSKISKEARELKCENENIYFGPVNENGRPSGYGKMFIFDGNVYIGEFKQGAAHGEGVLALADGGCYSGKFNNGEPEDQFGSYICEQTGYSYQGGIKKGQLHGRGKQRAKEYEFLGQYASGKRVKGVLTWKQFVYEGKFNNDEQFHGAGVLKDPKGVYHGEFKNGQKDGRGSYKSKLGVVYEGDYAKGVKSGRGKIYNKIGQMVFEGMLADDIPHGPGLLMDDDGKTHRVEFKQGLQKVSDHKKMQRTICDYL